MTSPSRTYRVIVSVTQDYVCEVEAGSPTLARKEARDRVMRWLPDDRHAQACGDERFRMRLATSHAGRCPFTEEFWPETQVCSL